MNGTPEVNGPILTGVRAGHGDVSLFTMPCCLLGNQLLAGCTSAEIGDLTCVSGMQLSR